MARFYEIKSSDSAPRGFGRRDFDSDEEYDAYECGYEHGYDAAMEEMSGVGARRVYTVGMRRRRDSRGRYM